VASSVQAATATTAPELARTGSRETGWLAAGGTLAVALGTLLVWRSRRRPQHS